MIAKDVRLGEGVVIHHPDLVNLYGCTVGAGSRIGTFVEIQRGAVIGARCKIQSHTFICEGVTIEDEVFVGHNVNFINDRVPRATNPDGSPQTDADWTLERTRVGRRASIGTGAGSVVTRDVAPHTVVAGNPARFLRLVDAASARDASFVPSESA